MVFLGLFMVNWASQATWSQEALMQFIYHASNVNARTLERFLTRVFKESGSAAGILYEKAWPYIKKEKPFTLIKFNPYKPSRVKNNDFADIGLNISETKDQFNACWFNVNDPLTRVADAIASQEDRIYINPNRQNYAQIDAFLVEKNILTLFQMTVAPKHSFNPSVVKAEMKRINKVLETKKEIDKNVNTSYTWRFAFVVLAKHISDFEAASLLRGSPGR